MASPFLLIKAVRYSLVRKKTEVASPALKAYHDCLESPADSPIGEPVSKIVVVNQLRRGGSISFHGPLSKVVSAGNRSSAG